MNVLQNAELELEEGEIQYADKVLIAIRRIIRAVDLHSRKLAQSSGLTGPQLVVLSEIANRDQASISDLAKNVHLSHATVTDILNRLEKRGLVARKKNGADKRKVVVEVTGAGREIIKNKPPLLQEKFVARLDRLEGEEKDLLLSMLTRIVSMMEMEEETLDSSPFLATGPLSASPESSLGYLNDSPSADGSGAKEAPGGKSD
ncbi:MAG: MarR family winged helix-turn-helix transcriptional regulator [Candidatus Nitrospinota bacterium M3_3B_026]